MTGFLMYLLAGVLMSVTPIFDGWAIWEVMAFYFGLSIMIETWDW